MTITPIKTPIAYPEPDGEPMQYFSVKDSGWKICHCEGGIRSDNLCSIELTPPKQSPRRRMRLPALLASGRCAFRGDPGDDP